MIVLGLGIVLVACSGAEGLQPMDAWARPMPPVIDVGAIYVTMANGGPDDDVLVAASSDRCSSAQLHDTVLEDSIMRMVSLESVDIPAGKEMEMGPTGLHIMCLGVDEPFVEGETIDVALEFEVAGSVTVSVEVEER